jgi:hypothetical protein
MGRGASVHRRTFRQRVANKCQLESEKREVSEREREGEGEREFGRRVIGKVGEKEREGGKEVSSFSTRGNSSHQKEPDRNTCWCVSQRNRVLMPFSLTEGKERKKIKKEKHLLQRKLRFFRCDLFRECFFRTEEFALAEK